MLFSSRDRPGQPLQPAAPHLLVRKSPQRNLPQGHCVSLAHNGRMTLGRSDDSDLRLEWDGISRSHAIVAWSAAPAAGAGQLSITCVKPCANGVFVNGERVDFALLDIGDIIALGCGAHRDNLPPQDAVYMFQVMQQQMKGQAVRTNAVEYRCPQTSPRPLSSSSASSSARFASEHVSSRMNHGEQHDMMQLDGSSSNVSEEGDWLVNAKYAHAALRLGKAGWSGNDDAAHHQQHSDRRHLVQQQLTKSAVALHEVQDQERQRVQMESVQQHLHQATVHQQQQQQKQQQQKQQQQQLLRQEQRERMQRGDYGSSGGCAAGEQERVVPMQGASGQPVGFGRRHVLGLDVDQQKKALEQVALADAERLAGQLRLQLMEQQRQRDAEVERVRLAATMEAEGRREAALQLQKLKEQKVEQLRFMGVGAKHVQQLQNWQPKH